MALGSAYRSIHLGPAAVSVLPLLAQHPREARFAGQVAALIGQHGHDARRGHGRKARLVGHFQQLRTLGHAQGMAGLSRLQRYVIDLSLPFLLRSQIQR